MPFGKSFVSITLTPLVQNAVEWGMLTMVGQKRFKQLLLATAVIGGIAVLAAPASAQDQPSSGQTTSGQPSSTVSEVVVTGSRIPRPEIDRLQPTIVSTSQQIENSGDVNLGDFIRENPVFQAYDETSGDRASNNNSGDAGVIFANLYNLGSQRTLTLVDGQRVVGAEAANGSGASGLQVDLSSIPSGLVQRIETISVGGAPIYGSDAIAGTVNVILKHDFDGLEVESLGRPDRKGRRRQRAGAGPLGSQLR